MRTRPGTAAGAFHIFFCFRDRLPPLPLDNLRSRILKSPHPPATTPLDPSRLLSLFHRSRESAAPLSNSGNQLRLLRRHSPEARESRGSPLSGKNNRRNESTLERMPEDSALGRAVALRHVSRSKAHRLSLEAVQTRGVLLRAISTGNSGDASVRHQGATAVSAPFCR